MFDLVYEIISQNGWGVFGEWWIGKYFDVTGRCLIEAHSNYLSGLAEENQEQFESRGVMR